MNIFENISLAFTSLRSSKMRSFLTMLGIIIGIGSVIAIVTVGNSLTYSITSAMEDLGANQIIAFVSPKEPNTVIDTKETDLITEDMIRDLNEYFGDRIKSTMYYEMAGGGQVKIGHRYANVSLEGTNADYLEASGLKVIDGTDIRELDVQRASNVCVVSNKFANRIFSPGVNPLGQEIQVDSTQFGRLTFTIIGIYEYELPAFMMSFVPDEDIQTQMIIPVTTAKRIVGADDGYSQIQIMFPPDSDSNLLSSDIQDFFTKYYRSNPDFMVRTQNMETMMAQMTTMLNTLSIAIAIIAAISLIVGGIGVMNIMLVSVTERTREIGTRKALGAKNSAIRMQFIIEAMILCLVGGIIGILLGLGLGSLGASILGFPASPSIPIIIIAVVFSMAIGIFFGFYPANKAAKLDPIEALRYE